MRKVTKDNTEKRLTATVLSVILQIEQKYFVERERG